MRGLQWLEPALRRAENAGMAVALVAFVAMVVITAADVGLRYIFNRPLAWAIPVTANYLIVAVYFCAVSATQRDRQHLGIDLFSRLLPRRTRAACAAFATLTSLAFCIMILAFTAQVFWMAWINDEVIPGIISWPLWASHFFVPLGFGLTSVRLIFQLVQDILGALGRSPYVEPPTAHGVSVE